VDPKLCLTCSSSQTFLNFCPTTMWHIHACYFKWQRIGSFQTPMSAFVVASRAIQRTQTALVLYSAETSQMLKGQAGCADPYQSGPASAIRVHSTPLASEPGNLHPCKSLEPLRPGQGIQRKVQEPMLEAVIRQGKPLDLPGSPISAWLQRQLGRMTGVTRLATSQADMLHSLLPEFELETNVA
jgi:hypothetical protein